MPTESLVSLRELPLSTFAKFSNFWTSFGALRAAPEPMSKICEYRVFYQRPSLALTCHLQGLGDSKDYVRISKVAKQ